MQIAEQKSWLNCTSAHIHKIRTFQILKGFNFFMSLFSLFDEGRIGIISHI